MAVTSKRSLIYFQFAAKVKNVPHECTKYISSYLIGTNRYLDETLQQVVFFKQEDDMDPKAWRRYVNKDMMLLTTDSVQQTMVGIVGPLKYALFSDGVRQPLIYYTDENENTQEIMVDKAVCVEGLSSEAVMAMYSVMQDSVLYTPQSFQRHFQDPNLLRYAALLAGFTDRGDLFLRGVRPDHVEPYCLQHFVMLGKLSRNDNHNMYYRKEDEGLFRDLIQFSVSTKNVQLMHRLDQQLDIHEFEESFGVYFIVAMVLFDGYNKPLDRFKLRNEKILFLVLNELLRRELSPHYLMKYACMVNLNVQSEAFRAIFHETVEMTPKRQRI